ncbi:hypothetical protein TanjilG_17778 [Lupinus angustifolius]|uniref:Uncharacterized protein n=1 Tax=Lupinus angustifolius TaxID=3871 RepID=A0A4P1RTT1_LUPAN|nr:PREDICTED: uncharacterized protein LOC109360762 [Lupinus angustifolius]OIW17942.1 hypothetical protein TanjilG_17778 [Lupinus angustifolius]
MPSGPKKRKAAKKKKQNENNINNLQGNDELKSQDEIGSDSGEVSSPRHHDHGSHHQNPFNEGSEEDEKRDPPAAQPIASDAKSMEEIPGDTQIDKMLGHKEDNVVLIAGDMKSEESSESKDVSFEHIETAKESCYGNENGSGTSNDESVTKNNPKDEDYNSIEEAIVCHELVKSIDSPPSDVTSISENAPVEETGNSAAESSVNSVKAVASLSVTENDDNGSVLVEKTVVPSLGVTDLAMKINEDRVYALIDEGARTSNLEEPKPTECDNEVLASLSANPFTKSFNGAEHIKESESPESSENQPLVASAPHIVQKTSWLSCCGLYEVVSGSDR